MTKTMPHMKSSTLKTKKNCNRETAFERSVGVGLESVYLHETSSLSPDATQNIRAIQTENKVDSC